MSKVIALRDIISALEAASDDSSSYLDPETGEIILVTEEERVLAEDECWEEAAAWQRELMPKIRAALEGDRWLELPDRFDIHEWSIMERFSRAQNTERIQRELLMPFTELVLFVHSGVQFEASGLNKGGISFETKLWPASHVAGWRSMSSNTRKRLAIPTGILPRG